MRHFLSEKCLAKIYLFKVNSRIIEKGMKYVQSNGLDVILVSLLLI